MPIIAAVVMMLMLLMMMMVLVMAGMHKMMTPRMPGHKVSKRTHTHSDGKSAVHEKITRDLECWVGPIN
jgi:hypothetical protein